MVVSDMDVVDSRGPDLRLNDLRADDQAGPDLRLDDLLVFDQAIADAAAPDAAAPDLTVGPDAAVPDVVSPYDGSSGYLLFNSANWTYHTNNNTGYPLVSGTAETTLIPDNVLSAGAAVLSANGVTPPFTVEFEFSIYDDDGGPLYASADGLCFIFGKDASAYGLPPTGGDRGFIKDGTGYGVHFSIYGSRQVILKDGNGTALQTNTGAAVSTIYTGGAWKKVRVDVTSTSVKVTYDGTVIINYTGAIQATTYRTFGFGAGTGGADGEHKIRNVQLLYLP